MADYKIDEIKRIPLFARCSRSELQALARNTDEIDLAAGKTLITQGHPNDTFFILLKGEVEVRVEGHTPHTLGPGAFFGEISMIDRGMATATVVTTTPVEALLMSHAQFQSAIKSNESIALNVMAVMAERLRQNATPEP